MLARPRARARRTRRRSAQRLAAGELGLDIYDMREQARGEGPEICLTGGVRCMWMRGGTSKGGYFLADDLPGRSPRATPSCCAVMGSPDPRQIDGMGGADPLTSKVAVVAQVRRGRASTSTICSCRSSSTRPIVTDAQNCGNILAGVGPFAIERGLVAARGRRDRGRASSWRTPARSRSPRVETPGGRVSYDGDARDRRRAGHGRAGADRSSRTPPARRCGALLPTGNAGRRDRRRRRHPDRQRHALRGDARRRPRHRPATRRREALEADAAPAGAGSRRSG